MNAKTLQSKQVGDWLNYGGTQVRIVDWNCLPEPGFTLRGERIDAEPFVLLHTGRVALIKSAFWDEII